MNDASAEAAVTSPAQVESQIGIPARPTNRLVYFSLVAGAAFCLYWLSSFILEARNATTHFGADTWYYAELAKADVLDRIAGNYYLDRIARFHPTTVALAAAWMKILNPLTLWIAPHHLLTAMFAVVGAVGVWAAMLAFAALIPRRYVILFGTIYAVSFGVWYFASIAESKIITATLSALYIASYLQLRERWTVRGVVLLTAILLFACLNEMVSGFLIIIPVVDTLVRRGWDWRHGWWIAAHGLAGPAAFIAIEGVMYGRLVAASHPEGESHLSLLIAYVYRNNYGAENLYSFVVNWLFFNIAAPAPDASYGVPVGASYMGHFYKGYFAPALANYFSSPASAGLVVLFGAMIAASVLPRYRGEGLAGDIAGLLWALLAYTLLRGVFFMIFNPAEPLLFSPAVALAHMLILAVMFTKANVPAKRTILAVFAVLLLITNGAFIVGG
jgi:hypothetical protein